MSVFRQEQDREQTAQVEMSSRVWICTSTHSSTKVMIMDVTQPSDLIDSFYVCNSCVLCIASVPGQTDIPSYCVYTVYQLKASVYCICMYIPIQKFNIT